MRRSASSARAPSPPERPLRVCHLGKYYPPAFGGIESHVQTLARAQAAAGIDVRVVCVNHANARGEDISWRRLARTATVTERDAEVEVVRLGRLASIARFDVLPGIRRALRAQARDDVDIVHLHSPNPAMLIPLALLDVPQPVVVSFHADALRQAVLRRLVRPFEHVVLRRAAAILCNSPNVARGTEVLERYREKVRVAPYGVDQRALREPSVAARAARDRLRALHPGPLWLSVGRLVYYKGLENAIDALAHVPGTLLIVGRGPMETTLRERAALRGVADRVRWLGRVDEAELIGAYHAATALWFPSNRATETFGLVQVEAMAVGCPVVNATVPASGVSWVSLDDVSGFTTRVDDVEGLVAASRRLLEEPQTYERLSRGAAERARSHFDCADMAQRTLRIYEEILRPAFGRHRDRVEQPQPTQGAPEAPRA